MIKRIDDTLLKNYRPFVLLVILIVLFMAILLPLSVFIYFHGNLTKEINPTMVNGILTVDSIIFGFVVLELREIKSSFFEKFLLSLPLLLFLIVTLEFVFAGTIFGTMTSGVGLIITVNCLFNILYVLPLMLVKQTHIEIEQKKEATLRECANKALNFNPKPKH